MVRFRLDRPQQAPGYVDFEMSQQSESNNKREIETQVSDSNHSTRRSRDHPYCADQRAPGPANGTVTRVNHHGSSEKVEIEATGTLETTIASSA